MKHTIKSIILLTAILIGGAGQAWAGANGKPNLGKIVYTTNHGSLASYKEEACTTPINTTLDGFVYSLGLTPVKDGSDETIGYKVYIKAIPAFGYTLEAGDETTGKVSFITAEVTVAGTDVAGARTRRGGAPTVNVGDFIDVTATETSGVYCVTMPADKNLNLHITATFPEKPYLTGVNYIDPTKTGNAQNATTPAGTHVYILDGTETVLGEDGKEMWYISNTTGNGLAYNSQIMIKGNVHLILADNSSMTVTIANDHPIYIYEGSADNPNRLHIYGQGGTTEGKLTATSELGDAINGNFDTELIINGGIINATGSSGIKVTGSGTVTINGGNITATSIGNNDHSYGIYGSNGITINGGQVTATSTGGGYGIATINSYITLGFSKTTDFIYANSYNTSNSNLVKTADGQRFVAYNVDDTDPDNHIETACAIIPSGDISNLATINGKMLRPLDGYLVTAPADLSFVSNDDVFSITTGEGIDAVTTHYGIYKASTEAAPVNVTVAYGGTGFAKLGGLPEGTTFNSVNDQPMQRSFAMPAQDVTVTATAVTGLALSGTYTYNGEAQTPAFKIGDDDFAAENYTVAYKQGDAAVTEAKNAGNYTATLTGLGHYVGTSADIEFAIGKKTLTLSADNVSVASNLTYTGSALSPEVTVSYTEYESVVNLTATDFIVSYDPAEVKNAGSYTATVSADAESNYTFGDISGIAFSVGKALLTVKAADKNVTYGSETPAFTATYEGFVGGDDASSLSGTLSFDCDYSSSSDAGRNFTITPSGLTSGNYDISYQTGTLTVTNAAMTGVSASGWSGQYDGNAHGITVSAPSGVTIKYRTSSSGSYDLTETPTFSSVGTHTVYYQVTRSNYDDFTGSADVVIDEAVIAYAGGAITQDEIGYSVHLTEGEGSANQLPVSGTVADLDYSRTLTAPTESNKDVTIGNESANLYTVCLPFSPKTGTDVKYYTLSKVEGTTLSFEEISGTPAAFTPYLVAVTGNNNFTEDCSNVNFETTTTIHSTPVDGYTFTGTLTGLENADAQGKYILQADNKWGKVTSENTDARIPPFRAYIEGPANGARLLYSNFDGDATGIQNIRTVDADGTEQWYDLNGRRIAKPTTKGVYIRNGKKTTN